MELIKESPFEQEVAEKKGDDFELVLDNTPPPRTSSETLFESYADWEEVRHEVGGGFLVRNVYVDITGDLIAGILLSQIDYWLPRTSIVREGRRWLAKSRNEWYDEIRITPRQYDTAIKRLQGLDLVEVENWRFNGFRTQHIHLREARLLELLNDYFAKKREKNSGPVLQKCKLRSYIKRNTGLTESVRPITKITTENTSRESKENNKANVEKFSIRPTSPPSQKTENLSSEKRPSTRWRKQSRCEYEARAFYENNVQHGKLVSGDSLPLSLSWEVFEEFWATYPDARRRDKKRTWQEWHSIFPVQTPEDFEKARPLMEGLIEHVGVCEEDYDYSWTEHGTTLPWAYNFLKKDYWEP